jgi:hypothetical protein
LGVGPTGPDGAGALGALDALATAPDGLASVAGRGTQATTSTSQAVTQDAATTEDGTSRMRISGIVTDLPSAG